MSFDIFFQTCHLSDQTEEVVNPFTGAKIQKPVGESATSAERAALRELLASAGASEPDEFGCYTVRFADGSSAELFADGLTDGPEFSGCMMSLRGLSPDVARFIYSLANAGNLAMVPAMEDARTLVTSTANAQRVASRWPDAVAVQSPEELHVILTEGFDAWRHFRDNLAGDS